MILSDRSLSRQSAVMVLLIFIIIAGIYSYISLPRESDPDITIPYIFIETEYEGMAPEDMEKLVTMPIERKLKGLSGTKHISSVSDEGLSTIKVEFNADIDIDTALQKVRDKVDQAKPDLPQDLPDDPVISEVNLSEMPILNVVLSGPLSLKQLKVHADRLEEKIGAVQGVLEAKVIGGLEREIHVEFDMGRLDYYGLPLSSLLDSLGKANVNMPGGSVRIGQSKYFVRVPEDFKTPDEIGGTILDAGRDGSISLHDVATIRDHHKDPTTLSRINGEQSVTIEVRKRAGENIIRINDQIRELLHDMAPLLPTTLKVDLTFDKSKDIRQMVSDLQNNILSGLLLVLIIVFAFIGGRSAAFISLAIPLSMLITFTVLDLFSYTLNMVILFALTLSLGMLVDNGIVVVENIFRHMQAGEKGLQAARTGTAEVAWPVIASTFTTMGAFFPMLFWPDMMGEYMSFLPQTVMIALSASLFIALVVNPVLSAKFQSTPTDGGKSSLGDRGIDILKQAYIPTLEWALDNPFKTLGIAFFFLSMSITGFILLGNGFEFMPESDPNRADVILKAPVGTSIETSDEYLKIMEGIAARYPDVKNIVGNVGESGGEEDLVGTHFSKISLEFVDQDERVWHSSLAVDEIRETILNTINDVEVSSVSETLGPPSGDPVNLEIYGDDIRTLGATSNDIRQLIKQIPGAINIRDNYAAAKPEIRVDVDKKKAAHFGINAYDVAHTVKTAVNGLKVGVYREGKHEYDIVARLKEDSRDSLQDVKRITVSGPNGEPIPITTLGDVSLGCGLGAINRLDHKRSITIMADVTGRTTDDVIKDIEALLASYTFPRGYTYQFTGEHKEQEDSSDFLVKAFVSALFLIFLVLATQFNSAVTPLIILTAVVLSIGGVMVGLIVTGMPFDVIMTGIGVLSLAGIVVNNAIVLIDCYEQHLQQDASVRKALVTAGATRFRAVLLTAVTTILGLIPMATGVSFDFASMTLSSGSETAQWWGPMAVAVIFGLAVATPLTLIVVPVLCSLKDTLFTSKAADNSQDIGTPLSNTKNVPSFLSRKQN